jgi:chemotaxis family two-component system response regulator Rcp1
VANILLVEDNLSDARLTIRALKANALPLEISVVKDGLEALDFLARRTPFEKAFKPNLILLDLNLPRMDGHELLARIKSEEQWKTIPVIVLSTSEAPADKARCLALNADFYFTKPIRYEDFSELVKIVEDFCLPQ